MDRRKFIKQNIATTSLAGLGPLAVSTGVFDEVLLPQRTSLNFLMCHIWGCLWNMEGRSYSLTYFYGRYGFYSLRG